MKKARDFVKDKVSYVSEDCVRFEWGQNRYIIFIKSETPRYQGVGPEILSPALFGTNIECLSQIRNDGTVKKRKGSSLCGWL